MLTSFVIWMLLWGLVWVSKPSPPWPEDKSEVAWLMYQHLFGRWSWGVAYVVIVSVPLFGRLVWDL